MPSVVGAAELASRRGFLVGLTISEVMLITLFVLLLLFRHSQDKAEQADELLTFLGESGVTAVQANSAATEINPRMQERMNDIMQELIDCRIEKDPACESAGFDDESPPLSPASPPSEETPESLEGALDEISRLKQELSQRDNQIKKLVESSVPGDIPHCTYEGRGLSSDQLRGKTISLGTFLIEPDGITLLERNLRFFESDIVDYNGLPYNNSAAASAALDWPLGEKMPTDSFSSLANEFIEIGDIETDTHKKCRFGALYYYETNDENLKIFNTIFQNYFFLGSRERISRERYENLVRVSGN